MWSKNLNKSVHDLPAGFCDDHFGTKLVEIVPKLKVFQLNHWGIRSLVILRVFLLLVTVSFTSRRCRASCHWSRATRSRHCSGGGGRRSRRRTCFQSFSSFWNLFTTQNKSEFKNFMNQHILINLCGIFFNLSKIAISKTSLQWNHHWCPGARLAAIEEVVNWTEGLADWSSSDGEVHFLKVLAFSTFLSLQVF